MAEAKLKDMTEKQLHEQLAEKRMDLVNARRSLAAGELPNPRVVASTKHEIAQILTVINDPSRKNSVTEESKEKA